MRQNSEGSFFVLGQTISVLQTTLKVSRVRLELFEQVLVNRRTSEGTGDAFFFLVASQVVACSYVSLINVETVYNFQSAANIN